jgi:DNA-binding MarR family transcriptional regulator
MPAEEIREPQSACEPSASIQHLTEAQYLILQALAKASPQLIKITDLAGSDFNFRRATVSEAVQNLEKQGLVTRPKGERSGIGITPTGLAALRACDRPSQ